MNSSNIVDQYFTTSTDYKIRYQLNFDPRDLDPCETVLIFNYGLVCSNAHWKYQLPFFKKSGYKILTHDYRFHYKSSSKTDIQECTFDNMTNDLYELISSLGISHSIQIAHSMGVNVTLEFAKKFPEAIQGQILISGTVFPPQDVMFDSNIVELASPFLKKFTKLFPKTYQSFWENAQYNPLARHFIFQGGFNTDFTSPEFIKVYLEKLSDLNPALFFQLLDEMKSHTVIKYLKKIKTPSLIIGGDLDQIIPNYLQLVLDRNLSNSELYIVKNGSHVPQVDFPEMLNERMDLFIQENLSCDKPSLDP